MNTSAYIKLFFVLKLTEYNSAARILGVFPLPSISHQIAFRPLIQELVNRGHEVTVITTDPMYPKGESPINLTEIDVHNVSYADWDEFIATSKGKRIDSHTHLQVALKVLTDLFEKQIRTEDVQQMLKDKNVKFDLILIEYLSRASLLFSHIYKAPLIQMSSHGPTHEILSVIGAPNHPLLYPDFTRMRLYNRTMWEKINELYGHCWFYYILQSHEKVDSEMLRRNFGDEIPSFSELNDNVHMLFLNIHPIWAGNIPVPPSVVFMGGVHQKPEKPLPKDLKDYLDSSTNGVIYMSFGTNIRPSMLSSGKIQLFVNVFSRLPYNILWKWDKDVLPGQKKNIRIAKWFPQADLLRHPQVKLFITQGGLQSTDEAITAGVPLLGIPMLGDQWYNTEKYVYHKIGLQLNLESLTEDDIQKAIDKIVGDKSYRENIVRLRTLMYDQPQPPLQRAAWWAEHALRHRGAAHLRAPAANMRWTRYYEVELVLTLLGCLLALLSACVFVLYLMYTYAKNYFRAQTKIKNH